MKIYNNRKGFSVVEGAIVIVIVAIIGLGGWYVWKKQNSNDVSKSDISQKQNESTGSESALQTSPDPTAEWTAYSNSAGKFSFKHPKTWVFAELPESCTSGLVLFASDKVALGRCASESVGQMMVMGIDGDVRANYKIGQGYLTGYKDITETAVTADGVTGTKQTAVASGQEGVGVLPDGTKVIQYAFFANNKTYIARYTQQATYPDASGDFDKLVTRTLKFSE